MKFSGRALRNLMRSVAKDFFLVATNNNNKSYKTNEEEEEEEEERRKISSEVKIMSF